MRNLGRRLMLFSMRTPRSFVTLVTASVLALLFLYVLPAAANHRPDRGADYLRSGLTLTGTGINGSARRLSGRIGIQTPRSWRHLNRNGSRSQYFRATPRGGCIARIHVSPRAEATRRTAEQQVDRAMRFRVGPLLGSGDLSGGARWALAVYPASTANADAPPPAVHRTLYGITVTPIAPRRFVHTRVLVTMSSGCTDADVRKGRVQKAVRRLLRTACVQARIS